MVNKKSLLWDEIVQIDHLSSARSQPIENYFKMVCGSC